MPAFSRICTMPTVFKAVEGADGSRYLEGIASSSQLDLQGEVVNQAALARAFGEAFEKNGGSIPYLRDHNTGRVAGRVIEFDLQRERLWTKALLRKTPPAAEADDLWATVTDEVTMSQSIGFDPIRLPDGWFDYEASGDSDEEGRWHWGGVEGDKAFTMRELSAVLFGACTDADLSLGKSLGCETGKPGDMREIAGVKLAELSDPEERRFYDDLHRATQSLTGMDNITRHWQKEGRAPSARVLSALLSPIGLMAEIVRAGRVLSGENRTAVESAVVALQDVLDRDTDSRATPEDEEAVGAFAAAWFGDKA